MGNFIIEPIGICRIFFLYDFATLKIENLLKFGRFAEAKNLLENSLKANETNGKLWKLHLKMLTQTETNDNLIFDAFNKSLKCLKLKVNAKKLDNFIEQ